MKEHDYIIVSDATVDLDREILEKLNLVAAFIILVFFIIITCLFSSYMTDSA